MPFFRKRQKESEFERYLKTIVALMDGNRKINQYAQMSINELGKKFDEMTKAVVDLTNTMARFMKIEDDLRNAKLRELEEPEETEADKIF